MSWFDPEEWIESGLAFVFEVFRIPLSIWFNLPNWVHWVGFAIVCLLTLLFFYVWLKSKDEWKYRS